MTMLDFYYTSAKYLKIHENSAIGKTVRQTSKVPKQGINRTDLSE